MQKNYRTTTEKKQSTKHIIIPVHQYFPKEMLLYCTLNFTIKITQTVY